MSDSPIPQRSARRAAPGGRLALAAALVLLAAGPTPTAVAAQAGRVPADNVLRDFQRTGDYSLVVNGRATPAEIYQNPHVAATLIISSAFPSPVLLSAANGTAATVNLMKVNKKPDGSIDLLADAVLAPQGPLDIDDEGVRFKAEGISAALVTAPPLLGPHPVQEVTAHNPEYLPRAASYVPNPQAVAALKQEKRLVTVRIFFGSWCPHCRELVPHAIKLEQLIKGSRVHFEYYGLPPRFGSEAPARQYDIKAVPTGIVFVDGKQVGRITGVNWTAPETTLVTILSGKTPPPGD